MKRKLKGHHFSLHVRFSSGDFNVAYCVLCSRGMYSLHSTWYWLIMSVLFFVFTDFVCKHQIRVVTYISSTSSTYTAPRFHLPGEFKAFNIVPVV